MGQPGYGHISFHSFEDRFPPRGGGRGEGALIALFAGSLLFVIGSIVLGFVAVLDPWIRVTAWVASAPGALMMVRSAFSSIGIAVGIVDRRRIGLSWRRMITGSLWLAVSGLIWSVIAVFILKNH